MNVPFETSPALAAIPGLVHGFFGRRGGISPAPFDSLNTSEANEDTAENVAENRARALGALGISGLPIAGLRQVHSAGVVTLAGLAEADERPEADGRVTRVQGVALSVLTADCAPVLFADPEAGVIGACHAGWKGAVSGILGATVEAMTALGAERTRIVAALGPAISGSNYEVGPEFARAVLDRAPYAARHIFVPEGKTREHFDLPGFVLDRLRYLGVGQIERIGGCTYAAPEVYFSHRRATHDGTTTGRQIALIALR